MVTSLDKKMLPLAKKILDKFGASCVLTRDTGTGNPSTGDVTEVISIATPVKCSPPFPATDKNWDNDIIQTGDAETFIAALDNALVVADFTPERNMKFNLVGSTEEWNIESVAPTRSGDQIAGYALLLRR